LIVFHICHGFGKSAGQFDGILKPVFLFLQGITNFRFERVPGTYYDETLEWRRVRTSDENSRGSSIAYLLADGHAFCTACTVPNNDAPVCAHLQDVLKAASIDHLCKVCTVCPRTTSTPEIGSAAGIYYLHISHGVLQSIIMTNTRAHPSAIDESDPLSPANWGNPLNSR
jgi:hypothetical protein